MKTLHTIAELRAQLAGWRAAGERIALVPTMGNLHDGHLTLVREARLRGDRVVVTIFVNPLQFGAGEDLDAYPRTLEADQSALRGAGADLLFAPAEREVYPYGRDGVTRVEVPGLADILCGASRPGHFVGVTTVVAKLFNMVQPDVALFGLKDFQQFAVLRRMVRDLDMPIEMVGVETVREPDGLAMSSRNGYLTETERSVAPVLYRVLRQIGESLVGGERDFDKLEREGCEALTAAQLRPDYLTIRSAESLETPEEGERQLVILAAAFLGRARLIDNLVINL